MPPVPPNTFHPQPQADAAEKGGMRADIELSKTSVSKKRSNEKQPLIAGGRDDRGYDATDPSSERIGGDGDGGVRFSPQQPKPSHSPGKLQMVILDFTEATGLDASAARSCFLMLKQLFKTHDIECVFVISSKKIRALLEAHDVIELGEPEGADLDLDSDDEELVKPDPVFSSYDDAVEWCEEKLLSTTRQILMPDKNPSFYARAISSRTSSVTTTSASPLAVAAAASSRVRTDTGTNLSIGGTNSVETKGLISILEDYLETDKSASPFADEALKAALPNYFSVQLFDKGTVLFEATTASDRLFLIEHGTVSIIIPPESQKATSPVRSFSFQGEQEPLTTKRLQKISGGGICGELGFFLERPQVFSAVASDHCRVWTITRNSFREMQNGHPHLAILLQTALLRSLSLTNSQTLETHGE